MTLRADFLQGLGFVPDQFQLDAFDGIDANESVVVAAPTGAGKTLVANYAIARALEGGRRVFYTTPIKALSNQKYNDLVFAHGMSNVGLLTGDNVINGDALIVVMTTEVLRNMLYAGADMGAVQTVVLDEVHYLQDAYRGPVWEEVIVHSPQHIQLVCLSATVSNAEELRAWLETVRGATRLVQQFVRPVELENLYLVGERNNNTLHLVRTIVGGKANGKGFRFDHDPRANKSRGSGNRQKRSFSRPKYRTPTRMDVAETLNARNLLPAIYFIFSRQGCDDAARAVAQSGQRFTTAEQASIIRMMAGEVGQSLSDEDKAVLGFDRFVDALSLGIGSHHAGLVPPLKELVERCFIAGLVQLVFATETLALGVNMPARTVVIEKLTKWTGDTHENLTPAQFTQMTGRAGRRGIDDHGQAIVLWSPWVRFETVARLAKSRDYVLVSAFRPNYNMAANLVRRYEPERARQLLNLSFAPFRTNSDVVRSEHSLEKLLRRRDRLGHRFVSDFGNEAEIRAALASQAVVGPDHSAIAFAMSQLVPGEVVAASGAGVPGISAVVSVSVRNAGRVRLKIVDAQGSTFELGPSDLDGAPEVIGTVELPEPYLPNSVPFLDVVASRLVKRRFDGARRTSAPSAPIRSASQVPKAARKALRQLDNIDREIAELRTTIGSDAASLGRQFDRVVELLERRGHFEGWSLTTSGLRLASLYHESDLLIVEALEDGVFDGLNDADLAAVASLFVYEPRGRDIAPTEWFPSADVRARYGRALALHHDLARDERRALIAETRQPHPGFVAVAHGWTAGIDIGDLLTEVDLTPGDFVRTTKQLVDVLRQLGQLAPSPSTASTARSAAAKVYRDIVSMSSAVSAPSPGPVVIDDDDSW